MKEAFLSFLNQPTFRFLSKYLSLLNLHSIIDC